MFDRHRRRRIRNALIGWFGPLLVRGWVATLRFRWLGVPFRVGRLPCASGDGIVVFWHQRLLTMGGYFHGSGYHALISQHSDGEMIARVVEGLGMRALRGSTTRGGRRVVREILRERARGQSVVLTPDGPRGPRYHFHPGAVYLASRTGLPVYPVAVSLRRAWRLPTWDGFLIPRPFTRALVRLGEAVEVPAEIDREEVEEYRKRLERGLRSLSEETDERFEELWREASRLRELPQRG